MPNIKKEIEKCSHPNSRRTLALSKQIKKIQARKKTKTGQFIKQNLIAEKVLWFKNNLLPNTNVCTAGQTEELIRKYLTRFDEELEQIIIKHSVGGRKNRQHANREDIINMTKKRDEEEFNTSGIEIPDLLSEKNMQVLLKWNGELRYLQNIKLRRISKKFLQQYKNKSVGNQTQVQKQLLEESNENDTVDKNIMHVE